MCGQTTEQELRTFDPLDKLDPQTHCEFYMPGWPRGQTVPTNLFLNRHPVHSGEDGEAEVREHSVLSFLCVCVLCMRHPFSKKDGSQELIEVLLTCHPPRRVNQRSPRY